MKERTYPMDEPRNSNLYDDIIDLPPHISKKHPPMGMNERAAQFSVFAALAEYDDAVDEATYLNAGRTELSEEGVREIRDKCSFLELCKDMRPLIKVRYFVRGKKRSGCMYRSLTGHFGQIDKFAGTLFFDDGTAIPIEDIYGIYGKIFEETR